MTKNQPLYREVIKKSLAICWKNKWLWFYGFFASVLGSGLAYEVFWKGFYGVSLAGGDLGSYLPPIFGKISFFESFRVWGLPWSIILTGLVLIIICLVIVFIAVVSYGALIYAVKKIGKGKNEFKEALKAGLKNFWHIFGYNALAKILTYALLFVASLPLGWFLATGGTGSFIVYFLIFILTVAASLVVSFLAIYASAGRIILGEDFLESIKNSFAVFKRHWIISLEMTGLLFLVNILAALLLATAMIFLSVPFFILFLGAYLLNSAFAFWIVLALALIIFGLATVIAGSFVSAFNLTAWTTLYLRIVDDTAVSKLTRLTKNLQNYFKFK